MKNGVILRAFALARANFFVYFNIRIYIFYFTYSLFKIPYIRLSILHYVLLKYQTFLKLFFLFSPITTIIYSLPLPLGHIKKE